MSKALVAYFSASGITKKLALRLAESVGADTYEIIPEEPYSSADLNWNDAGSRSSIEMNDKASRPAIASGKVDMAQYDTIFVGFPIWWYVAPHIINTFLESYDLTGKRVVPFATSGSSQMGATNDDLAPSCPGAELVEGKRFRTKASDEELAEWAKTWM